MYLLVMIQSSLAEYSDVSGQVYAVNTCKAALPVLLKYVSQADVMIGDACINA